jgi:hypothetical protein
MEAIRSSETPVNTRSTRRHIPEDGMLHNHRRENLKSYKMLLISSRAMAFLFEATFGPAVVKRPELETDY